MATPRIRESDLRTKDGFVAALAALKEASPHSYARLGKLIDAPTTTVHGWCRAVHLPYARETARFVKLLGALGVEQTDPWVAALNRLRAGRGEEGSTAINPYRGLEPYTEADADRYVRGDRALADLLAAIEARRMVSPPPPVVVLGPSGSGKTSLLRAGLVPALANAGVTARYVAASSDLHLQLEALADGGADQDGSTPSVIVTDQFEAALGDEDAVAQVGELAHRNVVVVVSVRSDFFERVASHPVLLAGVQAGPIVVQSPAPADLTEIITRPAERAGLTFEPELVAELARTFDHDATSGQVALPLLSHVLHRLAANPDRGALTLETYRRLGGIQDALAQAADEAHDQLTPAQQQACRTLFLLLVELGDQAHPVRRHLDMADLDVFPDVEPETEDEAAGVRRRDFEDVIVRLVEDRLLTIDGARLTISHERLISAWPRLEEWITDERAALLTTRRLGIAARAWGETDRVDDLLLTGTLLDEAIGLIQADRLPVDALTREFLARSAERHQRLGREQAELTSRQLAMQSALVPEASVSDQLAVLAWETAPTPEARSAVLSAARVAGRTRLVGEGGFVTVAAAPGGERAVTNIDTGRRLALLAPDDDGVWVRSGRVRISVVEPILMRWSPSGSLLLVLGRGGEIVVRDMSDLGAAGGGDRVGSLMGADGAVAAAWLDDDRAVIADVGALLLWHRRDDGWSSTKLLEVGSPVTALAGARGASVLQVAASTAAGTIVLWDLVDGDADSQVGADGVRLAERFRHEIDQPVVASSVALSADGSLIVAGWFSGEVRAWERTDSGYEPRLHGDAVFSTWVNDLAIEPDGSTLAAASSDGTVHFWTIDGMPGHEPWTMLEERLDHPSVVTSIDVVSGGFLTACEDGAVRSWPRLPDAGRDPGSIWSTPIDDRGRLLTATRNAVTRRPVATIDQQERSADDTRVGVADESVETWLPADLGVDALSGITAVTSDGERWATGGRVGDVIWWGGDRATVLSTGTEELIEGLAIGRNDEVLLAGDRSGRVAAWLTLDLRSSADADGAPEPASTLAVDPPVIALAIDPTGAFGCAACETGRASLIGIGDDASLSELATWEAGASFSISSAFHPSLPIVAIGNADRSASLWSFADPVRPRFVSRMADAAGHIFGVAFSSDGSLLAGASTDGGVWIWDVSSPTRPTLWASLDSGTRGMYSVTFTDGDRFLIGAGAQSAVQRWPLDVAAAANLVRRRSGDPMTDAEWRRFVPPHIPRTD